MTRVTLHVAVPFWQKVDRGLPDECWPWLGGRSGNGYGALRVNGRAVAAHREAFVRVHGPIPDGLSVLHACDNPPCCNPAHLFLGTHEDNMADMVGKGRGNRGERHGMARLTRAQVVELRQRYEQGESQGQLGRAFGICQQHVSAIVRGECW